MSAFGDLGLHRVQAGTLPHDVASPDVLRIIQWLRSLPAPSYSYGIPYEGLAACIESGLDPASPAMQEYAEE